MSSAINCGLLTALAALAVGGCSLADPRVGALQEACGLSVTDGGPSGATGSGYYGTSTSSKGGATCKAVTDNPCDECESEHCCASRSACYGDPVCACADMTLDECLDDAEEADAGKGSPAAAVCWSQFTAKGTVEQARVACERSWCQTECGIP
jgi:hypothetical protein